MESLDNLNEVSSLLTNNLKAFDAWNTASYIHNGLINVLDNDSVKSLEPPVVVDEICPRSRGVSDSSAHVLESLEVIEARQLYPMAPVKLDKPDLELQVSLLAGEYQRFLGCTTDGLICLTNYRLLMTRPSFVTMVNVPLGLFETIECRDMFYLHIYCKDSRIIRCSFPNNDVALQWFERISNAAVLPSKLQYLFAFAFHAYNKSLSNEVEDNFTNAALTRHDANVYNFGLEVERMHFDLKGAWRISYVNKDFKICSTYPVDHIVPTDISDDEIISAADYRSLSRFPSVVWRSPLTGAVIARSGQPLVGLLGWRNTADERLIEAITRACHQDQAKDEELDKASSPFPQPSKLLIMDARNYASAFANRGRGGGTECAEYYSNAEVVFMNMPNIHQIRKSLVQLRTLVNSSPTEASHSFLQALDSTGWLRNIALIIKASLAVCHAIEQEARPVLVHCSDGWDRTPQLTSMAQLLMDPYYRTIEGFKVLLEREWLHFGHKIADRCGTGPGAADLNERSPVFLQWLDSVYQVQRQFPTAFQFNETFLLKIILHLYSCLFGTFLCNSEMERLKESVRNETCSLWSLLKVSNWRVLNYLYSPALHLSSLKPSWHVRDLILWSALFCRGVGSHDFLGSDKVSTPCSLRSSSLTAGSTTGSEEDENSQNGNSAATLSKNGLQKTKSCDDIVEALELQHGDARRCSDSNLSVTGCFEIDVEQDKENRQDESCVACNVPMTKKERMILYEQQQRQCSISTDTLTAAAESSPVMSSCYYEDKSQASITLHDFNVNTMVAQHMSTSTSELSDSHCRQHDAMLRQVDQFLNNLCLEPKSHVSSSLENNLQLPFESLSSATAIPSQDDASIACQPTPRGAWDVDGSTLTSDPVQECIRSMQMQYENKVRHLESQLANAKVAYLLSRAASSQRCGHQNLLADAIDSSVLNGLHNPSATAIDGRSSGAGSAASSQPTSVEFDAVDEADAQFTLWVPDHMATHCAGCHTEFWFVRRRHHCRRCGQVFCSQCSDFNSPVPAQNLYDTVRVCNACHAALLSNQGSSSAVVDIDSLEESIS